MSEEYKSIFLSKIGMCEYMYIYVEEIKKRKKNSVA
jgi:hypothetical protein